MAIVRERVPPTGCMNRQRMGLLAILAQCGNKNARRIELMATQLRHQAPAGPLEQPPAAQLFQRRPRRSPLVELEILIAIVLGLDLLVLHPRLPLGHLLVEKSGTARSEERRVGKECRSRGWQ